MTDQVLIRSDKTGSLEIKRIGYFLPLYDIGDVVGVEVGKYKDESEITGIDMSIQVIRGEVVTMVIYTLESGIEAAEEEVKYFYTDNESYDEAMAGLEGSEDDAEGWETIKLDDERDPQGTELSEILAAEIAEENARAAADKEAWDEIANRDAQAALDAAKGDSEGSAT